MTLENLTVQQLHKLISIKERIEGLQAELDAITGEESAAPTAAPKTKGRRKMSAAAKARIAAGQKARWAKVKAGPKKRRKMSAAARKKMAAVAKARWAKAKAAGKTRL